MNKNIFWIIIIPIIVWIINVNLFPRFLDVEEYKILAFWFLLELYFIQIYRLSKTRMDFFTMIWSIVFGTLTFWFIFNNNYIGEVMVMSFIIIIIILPIIIPIYLLINLIYDKAKKNK